MQSMQNWKQVERCCAELREKLDLGREETVPLGLILGTGLGNVCSALNCTREVSYASLTDFPRSMSVSHKGAFLLGSVAGLPLLVASGRCHLYEGYSAAEVCTGVRVLAGLGVKTLILTNASGALNPQFRAGSLLCVTDQINWTGLSPLTGPNDDARGLRFPDLSRPYAPELVELACATAVRLGIYLERGVYIGVHGPELETPAETRLYRSLGADAIGMSSVLEVIAARHLGLRVLGLSCLGNVNRPDCMEEIVLEDILAACRRAENDLSRLLVALVPELQKRER